MLDDTTTYRKLPKDPTATQEARKGTRVLDRATRPIQLKVKEALHIERTPR